MNRGNFPQNLTQVEFGCLLQNMSKGWRGIACLARLEFMTINYETNICVYCGSRDGLTRDHVPPKLLFPKPRPSDLITVPCCIDCNQLFQIDDSYFRTVITLTYDTGKHPEAQKSWGSEFRALQREESKAYRKAVFGKAQPAKIVHPDQTESPTAAIPIDCLRICRFAQRTVLGLFFHVKGYRLADIYTPRIFMNPFSPRTLSFSKFLAKEFDGEPKTIGKGVFA